MLPDAGSGTSEATRGVRLLERVGFCVSALSLPASAYWIWLLWKDSGTRDPFGSGAEASHAVYLSVGWGVLAGLGLACGLVARGWLRRHATRAAH